MIKNTYEIDMTHLDLRNLVTNLLIDFTKKETIEVSVLDHPNDRIKMIVVTVEDDK